MGTSRAEDEASQMKAEERIKEIFALALGKKTRAEREIYLAEACKDAPMWGLTMVGGFGGNSGRSMWWEILILPYLIGWSMGIWGPGSPRWLLVLGIVIGLFYQVILAIVLTRPHGEHAWVGAIIISALGVMTIIGCISRLRNRTVERC